MLTPCNPTVHRLHVFVRVNSVLVGRFVGCALVHIKATRIALLSPHRHPHRVRVSSVLRISLAKVDLIYVHATSRLRSSALQGDWTVVSVLLAPANVDAKMDTNKGNLIHTTVSNVARFVGMEPAGPPSHNVLVHHRLRTDVGMERVKNLMTVAHAPLVWRDSVEG
eukprot:PhF_6_TR26695/c1_g2_i3/m.38942